MREFPSISNYNIAVENQYYREQNNKFKPEFRNSGELHFEPGGRAVVYKVSDNSNVVKAIKLFTGNRDNLFDRYSNISDYLLEFESDYLSILILKMNSFFAQT